ncbi:AEC family transporter [Clostridium sp. Ade.TY]|uniref:AEC family transporter n=1 Tax=Clostridium sp. Ade.TY TaxID=1391647 RepID=UPI000465F815|nr:AEC family transporter [Clostridium sp. Ade.TY]
MNITIINQVIILFLIIIVGIYASKKKIITDEGNKTLSNFLLNIALPFLILSSFDYNISKEVIHNACLIFIYSAVIHIFLILVSKLFCLKYDKDKSIVSRCALIYSNAGFMGYPLMAGLYGNTGVFYTAIYGIPYNILLFTYGVMLFNKTNFKTNKTASIKKILLNPGIIAIILGSILLVTNYKLPYPISQAISLVGNMTTPLAMLIVGSMLSKLNIKEIFKEPIVYYISFIKLIIIPILIFILATLIKADYLLKNICILLEATPSAVVCSAFATQYNIEKDLAAKLVFITTLFSIITIPIIMSIL